MLKVKQKLEEFYNNEINNYNERWTDRACDIIADVYAVGLNTKWCEARLESCDYVGIRKAIINKCRDLKDFWATEPEDKKVVEMILQENKKALFQDLNSDIYTYCIL